MMTKTQYIQKMKNLGWSDDYIQEQLQIHDDAAKDGVIIPLEVDMGEAPIQD